MAAITRLGLTGTPTFPYPGFTAKTLEVPTLRPKRGTFLTDRARPDAVDVIRSKITDRVNNKGAVDIA